MAYAAWTWVPIFSDRDTATLGWGRVHRPYRLRLFADAYGLTTADRVRLVGTIRQRIVDHIEGIRRMAAAGEPAFVRIVQKGHLRRPERDLRLIDFERAYLEGADRGAAGAPDDRFVDRSPRGRPGFKIRDLATARA